MWLGVAMFVSMLPILFWAIPQAREDMKKAREEEEMKRGKERMYL